MKSNRNGWLITIGICLLVILIGGHFVHKDHQQMANYQAAIQKKKQPKIVHKTKTVNKTIIKKMPATDLMSPTAKQINHDVYEVLQALYTYDDGHEYANNRLKAARLFTPSAWKAAAKKAFPNELDPLGKSIIDKEVLVSTMLTYQGYFTTLMTPERITRAQNISMIYLVKYNKTMVKETSNDRSLGTNIVAIKVNYSVPQHKLTYFKPCTYIKGGQQ